MLATYILGPIVALLPQRWRNRVLRSAPAQMARSAMLSGILETLLAIAGLVLWYSIFVTLAGHVAAHSAVSVPDQKGDRVGMFAYIWFWLNPVTWIVAYFIFEGVVRYVAALSTGEAYGSLPLCFAEFVWRHARKRETRPDLPLVADEIASGDASCDMKIASCRRKPEWKYPFAIRYAGAYFQVIASADLGAGPRPYVYSLRRLPPGEIARGLKEYQPDDILTVIPSLEPIER